MITTYRDRYIIFRILSKSINISFKMVKDAVWDKFQLLYGLDGTTTAGLYFEKFDEQNKIGLVRCSHISLTMLLVTLTIITKIDESEILIYPEYVTGTIRKANKYLLKVIETN